VITELVTSKENFADESSDKKQFERSLTEKEIELIKHLGCQIIITPHHQQNVIAGRIIQAITRS
jgi:hypothetical protein